MLVIDTPFFVLGPLDGLTTRFQEAIINRDRFSRWNFNLGLNLSYFISFSIEHIYRGRKLMSWTSLMMLWIPSVDVVHVFKRCNIKPDNSSACSDSVTVVLLKRTNGKNAICLDYASLSVPQSNLFDLPGQFPALVLSLTTF